MNRKFSDFIENFSCCVSFCHAWLFSKGNSLSESILRISKQVRWNTSIALFTYNQFRLLNTRNYLFCLGNIHRLATCCKYMQDIFAAVLVPVDLFLFLTARIGLLFQNPFKTGGMTYWHYYSNVVNKIQDIIVLLLKHAVQYATPTSCLHLGCIGVCHFNPNFHRIVKNFKNSCKIF